MAEAARALRPLPLNSPAPPLTEVDAGRSAKELPPVAGKATAEDGTRRRTGVPPTLVFTMAREMGTQRVGPAKLAEAVATAMFRQRARAVPSNVEARQQVPPSLARLAACGASGVCVDPDGVLVLASGGTHRMTVSVLDAAACRARGCAHAGAEVVSFATDTRVTGMAWDPRDLNFAAVVGNGSTAVHGYDLSRLPDWNDTPPRPAWTLTSEARHDEHGGDGATDVAFLPPGTGYTAAAVSRGGVARLWDARASRRPQAVIKVPNRAGGMTRVAAVANGQGLLAGTTLGNLILWDLRRSTSAAVAFAKPGTQHHAPLLSLHAPSLLRDTSASLASDVEVASLRLHPTTHDRVLVHLANGQVGRLHLSAGGTNRLTSLGRGEGTVARGRARACWAGGGVAVAAPARESVDLHLKGETLRVPLAGAVVCTDASPRAPEWVCVGTERGIGFLSLADEQVVDED